MLWKISPEVEAARKLPGWAKFHRECGKIGLYFDHIERHGGKWQCVAYTVYKHNGGYATELLHRGVGATVLDALADAHRHSGRASAHTETMFKAMIAIDIADMLE